MTDKECLEAMFRGLLKDTGQEGLLAILVAVANTMVHGELVPDMTEEQLGRFYVGLDQAIAVTKEIL